MAKSAVEAGWDVTVYARWHRGLAPVEQRDGYRLVRAPRDWRYLVPGLRAPRPPALQGRDGAHAAGRDCRRRDCRDGRDRRLRPSLDGPPRFRPLERWHWWQRIREFPLTADGLGGRPRRRRRTGRHLARDVGGLPAGARSDAPPAWRPDRSTTAATSSCSPGSSPDSAALAGTCWNGRSAAGHAAPTGS